MRSLTLRRLALAVLVVAPGSLAACVTTSTSMGHARDALALGDEAAAEQHLRAALNDPAFAEEARAQLESMLLRRAEAQRESGAPDDAVAEIYREILVFAPHSNEARVSLGRLRMRQGDHAGALEVLTADDRCLGCGTLAAVVYFERGRRGIEAENWGPAVSDLEAAFARSGDPMALVLAIEAYTRGGHGTADDAIGALIQAGEAMDASQPGLLNSWVGARRAIAVNAARRGEIAGVEQALVLSDPRELGVHEAMLADFSLRLAVAQGELDGGFYDEGIRRAAAVFIDARHTEDPAVLEQVRDEMVALFSLRAAELIRRGEGKMAAESLEPALRVDPDNVVIRYQQLVAVAAWSTKRAKPLLDDLDPETPGYDRARALYYTIRAREYLEAGQYTAARSNVNRARKLAPNLLEVRLARAEIMATSRFGGLTKAAAREFRELGEFQYPQNRINRYAEALGQIAFIRDQLDDAALQDPLRGPQFVDRMETLESNIRSFYPYAVDWRADDKAQLILDNDGEEVVEVEVAGIQRKPELVAVPPHGKADVVLDAAGYVRVATPDRRLGVFAEPGTRIVIAAGDDGAARVGTMGVDEAKRSIAAPSQGAKRELAGASDRIATRRGGGAASLGGQRPWVLR